MRRINNQRNQTEFIRKAARRNDIKRIQELSSNGFAINEESEEFSILHEVLARTHNRPTSNIAGTNEVIACLDRCGADWCKRDRYGRLPIHMVAVHSERGMLDQALMYSDKWRFDTLECRDNMGRHPLHYAAHYRSGGMFMWMCEHEILCKLSVEDDRGYTPVHILAKVGAVDHLEALARITGLNLLQVESGSGITLLEASACGCQPNSTRYLLDVYRNQNNGIAVDEINNILNKKNGEGESLLFVACKEGRRSRICSYIEFLLRRSVDFKTTDLRGNTLLHAVALQQTSRTAEDEIGNLTSSHGGGKCFPLIKRLVELDPSILYTENADGATPLAAAVDSGNQFVVASILWIASTKMTTLIFGKLVNQARRGPVLHNCLVRLKEQTTESQQIRFMQIAELLLISGANVDEVTMRLVEGVAETQSSHQYLVERISRLARLRRQTSHTPTRKFTNRIRDLPQELFEIISKYAVRDEESQKRLAIVNGSDSCDKDLDGLRTESDVSDE
jgi:ankyrin repeat protein